MRRFDLLRSPLLLLAVAVLLLNDFVLKAAFHNGVTGKLSDVTGLAAFTIFCCALWPRHVRPVGAGITVLFVLWKSPYASGAIEAANAVLPFAIGRTVDYTDLIVLPVVWLVCRHAHRLPLQALTDELLRRLRQASVSFATTMANGRRGSRAASC